MNQNVVILVLLFAGTIEFLLLKRLAVNAEKSSTENEELRMQLQSETARANTAEASFLHLKEHNEVAFYASEPTSREMR